MVHPLGGALNGFLSRVQTLDFTLKLFIITSSNLIHMSTPTSTPAATPSTTVDAPSTLMTPRVKAAGVVGLAGATVAAYGYRAEIGQTLDGLYTTPDEAHREELGWPDPDAILPSEGCSVGCGTASIGLALAFVAGVYRKQIIDIVDAVRGS